MSTNIKNNTELTVGITTHKMLKSFGLDADVGSVKDDSDDGTVKCAIAVIKDELAITFVDIWATVAFVSGLLPVLSSVVLQVEGADVFFSGCSVVSFSRGALVSVSIAVVLVSNLATVLVVSTV